MSTLEHCLKPTRIRLAWRRSAPALAVLGGASGLLVAGGVTGWALLAVPLAVAWVAATWPSWQTAAQELDRRGALEGALECAWDHRADPHPIAQAQQSRAVARAQSLAQNEVKVSGPSPAWALPLLLWATPLLIDTPPPEPNTAHSSGATDVGSDGGEALTDTSPPDGGVAKTRKAATTDRKRAAPNAEGDAGAAKAGASANGGEQGGVGKTPGSKAAYAAERAAIERARAADELAVGRGHGPAAVVARGTADAPPVAPTDLDDDVTDPARVYPARYRKVVGAYFSRAKRP